MLRASSLGCWPAQSQKCRAMPIRAMSSGMKSVLSASQTIPTLHGTAAESCGNGRMKTQNERGMSDDRTVEKGKGHGQSSIRTVEMPHVGTLTLKETTMTNGLVKPLVNPVLRAEIPRPASILPPSMQKPLSVKSVDGISARKDQRSLHGQQYVPCNVPSVSMNVKVATTKIATLTETSESQVTRHLRTDAESCTQAVEFGSSTVERQEEGQQHIIVDQKPQATHPHRKVAKSHTQPVDSGSSTVKKLEKEKTHVTVDSKPRATPLRSNLDLNTLEPGSPTVRTREEEPHITVDPSSRATRSCPIVAKSHTQAVEFSSSAVGKQEKEQPHIIVDQKFQATGPQQNVAKSPTQPVDFGSSTVREREKENTHVAVDLEPRATPSRDNVKSNSLEPDSSTVRKREKEEPHVSVDPRSRATRACPIIAKSRTQAVESTIEKQEEQELYVLAESPHYVGRTWRPLPIKPINMRPLPPSFSKNDEVKRAWVILHETASSDDAWNAYVTLNEYAVPVPLAILHRLVRLVSRDRPRASTEYTCLLEILKRIRVTGGKVYLFEWNALIDAAGRGWRKTTKRHYELALSFLRDMTKGRMPGTTLALDSGSSNVEDEAIAESLDPDIYTYTTLLGIAARTKDPDCLHHARVLLERSQISPNRITHLALVPYFSATSQLGAVRSTLLKLEGENLELGLDGINALLFAYGKKRRLDVVTMIYRLLKHNLTPNLDDVEEETKRLEEYRHQLRTEEFIVVPDYFVPNEVTYTSLIQIMTYHGHLTSALMIFADMMTAPNTERGASLTRDAEGVPRPSPYLPTTAIFRALFLGFRRHAKPPEVHATTELKKRDEDSSDEWTLDTLQRVFDLFLSMPSGVYVGPSALYWLIMAYQAASGNDRELLRNVWLQVEGRFRSSSIGQNNRLHRIKVSLFSEEM